MAEKRSRQQRESPEGIRTILEFLDQHGTPSPLDPIVCGYTPNEKKQAKKRAAPTQTLDLHGKRSEEACILLRSTVLRCRETGIRELLVIHGKGTNSDPDEGPVLKRTVEIMIMHELKPFIREAIEAPRNRGGSGATILKLR